MVDIVTNLQNTNYIASPSYRLQSFIIIVSHELNHS